MSLHPFLFGVGLNGVKEARSSSASLRSASATLPVRFFLADAGRGQLPRFTLHVLPAAVEFGAEYRHHRLLRFELRRARPARRLRVQFRFLPVEPFGFRPQAPPARWSPAVWFLPTRKRRGELSQTQFDFVRARGGFALPRFPV